MRYCLRHVVIILAVLLAVSLAGVSRAAGMLHPAVPTVALVKIQPGGKVEVTLIHDALAFALNDTSARISDAQMYAFLAAPAEEISEACEDGRKRLVIGLRLMADGQPVNLEISESPTLASINQWKIEHPTLRLPCKLEFILEGTLPPGTKSVTFRYPEILSDLVMLVERPGLETSDFPLAPAEVSNPIDVSMATAPAPAAIAPQAGAVQAAAAQAGAVQEPADATTPKVRSTDYAGAVSGFWSYIKFGFRHIIPKGADHALFVLGLFLLSPRIKPVLWQITAFTVAHTLTLALTTLHIIGMPSSIVEPIIALSIAFIGIENLLTTKVHPWRPAIAFIFGLVHGMGVASAFDEVGFTPGHLISSLAAFTIGVEAGHLAVLAAAFALLAWTRDKKWYRARVAIPISVVISIAALFWTVQRVMPEGPGEAVSVRPVSEH